MMRPGIDYLVRIAHGYKDKRAGPVILPQWLYDRAKADGVDLQYFVAVTGPDQAILSKRSFPVHIAIPEAAKRAGITDHLEETIPLTGQAPGDLNIVLGFQQSPEAVDFYRHFRGR